MKNTEKRTTKIAYISCYCILSALFLYFILHKGYTIIAYDTPKELREMNTVVFAYQFAHANNPYSVASLANDIPVPTSIYGLLVPLLISAFIHLFSMPSLIDSSCNVFLLVLTKH